MQLNQKLKTAIDSAKSILISTHIFPDADGIGSQISLCLALRSMGKNCICANEEELLERYKYLDKQNVVTSIEKAKDTKPDLIIIVDTNTKERTGKKMMSYYSSVESNFLFIDHHPCSAILSDDHCIDTTAAATGQIVGEFTEFMGIPFNTEMALALYTSIIIDTSSFRYPTVSSRTHLLVSKLLQTGIEPTTAYNGIYGTKTIQHLHLLGKILGSAKSNEAGNIYWIVFDQDDLDAFETDIEDTHAFINHLLIMDNIKVACMIRDDGDQVKVSLRSTGICDVGTIATTLGGGGHSHSAATIIKKTKPIDEIIKETIETIEGCLKD
jgi:phosphoesterase RecJ-like protein